MLFIIMVTLVGQSAFGNISGKVLSRNLQWKGVHCTVGKSLRLTWGPEDKLEISIPHFKRLLENSELVIDVADNGTASFQQGAFENEPKWVVDVTRHSEAQCRVKISEMAKNPISFKVGIDCTNMVPSNPEDGGAIDVSSETAEKVVCQEVKD